jgi:hypothetical protein
MRDGVTGEFRADLTGRILQNPPAAAPTIAIVCNHIRDTIEARL